MVYCREMSLCLCVFHEQTSNIVSSLFYFSLLYLLYRRSLSLAVRVAFFWFVKLGVLYKGTSLKTSIMDYL